MGQKSDTLVILHQIRVHRFNLFFGTLVKFISMESTTESQLIKEADTLKRKLEDERVKLNDRDSNASVLFLCVFSYLHGTTF